MARKRRRVLRILGWIAVGFFSLILVITLGFYLGRGWIMSRAVTYLNKQQPGEITIGQMNLIPLVNFPDVTLQLKNVSYYEKDLHPDSLYMEPILSLSEIFVRLDVVEMIRGNIEVSQARVDHGFVRYEIYPDSVSNFERALGIRFGEGGTEDTLALPGIRVDLERLEIADILALMEDHTRDDRIEVQINQWESSFNYLPDRISSTLKLDIDIKYLKYLTYRSETNRNILLESEVLVDPVGKEIVLDPSSMKISGLEMETWGTYSYRGIPHVDIFFRASNEGLEVLNFIFRGVLDLNEIEQIGAGKIYLSGHVAGDLGEQLPVVRLNGTADQIGFRIKPIQKDVRDITFQFYATNGKKSDLSEGLIQINDFSATFPEGTIQGDASVINMVSPQLSVRLKGDIELTGLEQMLKSDKLTGLEGNLAIEGNINGVVDRINGEFLNDSSYLNATLREVGFTYHPDSLTLDSVKGLQSEIQVQNDFIHSRNMELEFNGNRMKMEVYLAQLVPYLMGFDRDLRAELTFTSDWIDPGSFLNDSLLSPQLGEPWRDLHFILGANLKSDELESFLKYDSIPRVNITLDSFGVDLSVYADITDLYTSISIGPDTIVVDRLRGNIGQSSLDFSGSVINYGSLVGRDSGEVVHLDYKLTSDTLFAGDLFTFNNEFLLPEAYRSEYLAGFNLSGELDVPAYGLGNDTISPDFGLNIYELGGKIRSYPLTFDHFLARIRREGNQLFIDNLEGKIGESNLKMNAMVGNFTDTILENLYGNLELESDLLDLNELMSFPLPGLVKNSTTADSASQSGPPRLDQFEYPDFEFSLDIGEMRYEKFNMTGIQGKLRTSKQKIFYLDRLYTALEGGGSIEFSGMINVSSPDEYSLSSKFDVKDIDLNKLDFEMQTGEETYTLRENFRGLISANGLAEVFLTPELSLDIPTSTAVFNVKVVDGALINFTPLQAAAKYLDNKDLNNVRFATLGNSFPLTLVDSKIIVPLTFVESTIGHMWFEGEQGLDDSYLYLLRLPTWLVKGAAKSRLSTTGDDQEEDQIQEYKGGRFLNLTVWGEGEESDVKLGDRRKKYQ
jgi:hypothetical protein